MGFRGENYLHVCARCSKRGLKHVGFLSLYNCWRFSATRVLRP